MTDNNNLESLLSLQNHNISKHTQDFIKLCKTSMLKKRILRYQEQINILKNDIEKEKEIEGTVNKKIENMKKKYINLISYLENTQTQLKSIISGTC